MTTLKRTCTISTQMGPEILIQTNGNEISIGNQTWLEWTGRLVMHIYI